MIVINKAITNAEEGGAELNVNSCCKCREGFIMGNEVYCNLDGQFHPLYDDFECKSFIPKNANGKQPQDYHRYKSIHI